jgi:hypothetical protein
MPKVLVAMVAAVVLHATVAPARASDEFNFVTYVRLGQGVVFDSSLKAAPAFGFGMRGEMERFAIDVSGLNLALRDDFVDTSGNLVTGSVIKMEVLRFLTPQTRRSAYAGGGLSWGLLSVGRTDQPGGMSSSSSWSGGGLQGEATVGYEVGRKSPVRFFVQADASLPFFRGRSQTYDYRQWRTADGVTSESRYLPSLVVSAGVGWHRR